MNLAVRDVRRHLGRFIGTAAGLGLLLSVVIAMQGVYAGMVEDATSLTRAMRADLWLVQRDTSGPFAETSRLDPTVEGRAAALPGVRSARPYTYQLIRRALHGDFPQVALVGLGWPDDPGRSLPLVRGRRLVQPHGEMIVDATLGLELGESLTLAGEPYRVVGLTKNAFTYGGDSVAFMTVADTQLVALDQPPEATLLERQRALERLRRTDLGRGQPATADLLSDPRWRSPSVSPAPLAAVLVEVEPNRSSQVVAAMRGWGDVSVHSQDEEERLLLAGVVWTAAPIVLELLRGAANPAEHARTRDDFASLPEATIDTATWERALEVQSLLARAQGGRHRGVPPIDLLIAAAAEHGGIPVLHRDRDFEIIAGVTGQPVHWFGDGG